MCASLFRITGFIGAGTLTFIIEGGCVILTFAGYTDGTASFVKISFFVTPI